MIRHAIMVMLAGISVANAAPSRPSFEAPFRQITLDDLRASAFDSTKSIESRWRAVTSIGKSHFDRGQKDLEKAMLSKDWFLRNAALVVVHYGDRDWALRWSEKLMNDPALVVRTAAVQAIRKLGGVEKENLLWQKLNSKENFRGQSSLWIRKHIAETLGDFASAQKVKQFEPLLGDRDPALRQVAVKTLQRVTKLQFKTEIEWKNYLARLDI